jgi:hypothetical protein
MRICEKIMISYTNKSTHIRFFALTMFFLSILFWILRFQYWLNNAEEPFSDMASFQNISENVLNHWNFAWSDFWLTYSTPTLFVMRASEIFLFGQSLFGWEVFQTILLWISLLWLCVELLVITNNMFLPIILMTVVTLSRSSIFWSYKLSRESIHEMFTYLMTASFFYMLRKNNCYTRISFGIISMVAILNRPNTLLVLIFAIGLYLFHQRNGYLELSSKKIVFFDFKKILKDLIQISIGALIIWAPWGIRNYKIYHQFVPLSTQAPYTFLWDLGKIKVELPDRKIVVTDVNELQSTAYSNFKNDLEASKYASSIMFYWIKQNFDDIPSHVIRRISSSIEITTEYLSKLSRTQIYDNNVDKYFLVDKNLYIVILGVIGLCILPFFYAPEIAMLGIAAIVPWITGAAMLGYPRMLDPTLPIIIFGSSIFLIAPCIAIKKFANKN